MFWKKNKKDADAEDDAPKFSDAFNGFVKSVKPGATDPVHDLLEDFLKRKFKEAQGYPGDSYPRYADPSSYIMRSYHHDENFLAEAQIRLWLERLRIERLQEKRRRTEKEIEDDVKRVFGPPGKKP